MKLKGMLFIIAFFIFCLLSLSACPGKIGDSCKMDSECRSGLICYYPPPEMCYGEWIGAGTCRRPCKTAEDCEGGLCAPGGACFSNLPPTSSCDAGIDASLETAWDDTQQKLEIPDTDSEHPSVEVPECGEREVSIIDGSCVYPIEYENFFRMVVYRVGIDGHPGSGLNLDSNPQTCSPGQNFSPPLCSEGIDNAMAQLGVMGNSSLDIAIEQGTMNILMKISGMEQRSCFYLDFMSGIVIQGEPGCVGLENCVYAIGGESIDQESCVPFSVIGNAFIDGNSINAGGDEFIYYFDAIVVGLHIVIPILRPQLIAQVQLEDGIVTEITGLLGGYIREADFIGAFESIPEEEYPQGIDKESILQMWHEAYANGTITKDFDHDGDTIKESSSIGIIFSGVPVIVSGIYEK